MEDARTVNTIMAASVQGDRVCLQVGVRRFWVGVMESVGADDRYVKKEMRERIRASGFH